MNTRMRRAAVAVIATTMAVSMAACGKAGDDKKSDSSSSSSGGGTNASIGLLLPDSVTARYEKFDKPYFEAKVKELCSGCTVQYANANASAATQAQQVSTMITKGVKVIVISAQDSAAIKSSIQQAVNKGIKVVAYDRLAQGPVSAYVSFDNVEVGKLQGEALLTSLGSKATPKSKIVMINGDDADPNAAQFKKGAHEALDGKVDIAYEQSGLWKDTVANQKVTAAITQLGAKNIAGVYSANDGMAGGIATALKGAGISGIPLTGQDAELAGIHPAHRRRYPVQHRLQGLQAGGRGRRDARRRPGAGQEHLVARHHDPDQRLRQQGALAAADPGVGHQGQHQGHGHQGRSLHRRADLHRRLRQGVQGGRSAVIAAQR